MNASKIIDSLVGLLALGAVLYYVFKDGQTTTQIVGSLAGGFGTVEGALQGRSTGIVGAGAGAGF